MSKGIFVVFNKKTFAVLKLNRFGQYYGIGAAKAALTRHCKASGLLPNDPNYPLYSYGVINKDHYENVLQN
jgi:hypothetical protein